MDSEEIIEMDELVIVGSRYSKDLKDRLLPIYEKGEPMSAEELGRLLGGTTLVVRPVDDNYFDYYAVGVRTEENLFLGFVWMYQSYALREWMEEQGLKCIKARIKRVNTRYGLIFAEVEGLKLRCQVRNSYDIDRNWASGLPRVLAYNNGMSLDVAMFLLHEALTENMDYKQLSGRFDNLLADLPTDLSAHYYRECVEMYQMMGLSPSEKVRELRDTLLHTFVNRGSTEKMEWWVKECLPRFIRLAEDNDLLGLYEAANFTLERVEALLASAPNNLFYLYKYNRVHFAKQLYYSALPDAVYNQLLTLLAVRELMLEKKGVKEHNGIDKRIHKTIETLRQEGLLKHLYDFTWVMETMNQTEGLPKFNTPRSYITYMQSLGIKNLPSEDSINRKQNTFIGKFPDWEFSDCDMTEATRRINIGKRFLSIFRSI